MSKHDDTPEERRRVFARIAPIIMAWYASNPHRQFHVEELRQLVLAVVPTIAPDSPGRILRELRLSGMLDYIVVNRRQSLYRFRPRAADRPRPGLGGVPGGLGKDRL